MGKERAIPTEAWRRVQAAQDWLRNRGGSERGSRFGHGMRSGGLLVAGGVALLMDALSALLGPVAEALSSTMGWGVSAVLFPVEAVLAIPYLGRVLALLQRAALTVFWALIGLPDALLCLMGVRPEKRLRLWILVPQGEGVGATDRESLSQSVDLLARILRREANVRLVPITPFQSNFPFAPPEAARDGWLIEADDGVVPGDLAVGCHLQALLQDLGLLGGRIAGWQMRYDLGGGFRRLSGWGPPLMVLPVASVAGGRLAGCSLGPITDYVTLDREQPICLAHEVGHACNLPHSGRALNLMNPTCGGVHLDRWQVALLRLSRHVTYF